MAEREKIIKRYKRIPVGILTFSLILSLFFGFSTMQAKAESGSGKKILFISSYSPAFPTFFLQVEGLQSELNDGKNVLDIEFMDTKRFPEQANYEGFNGNLRYKLERLPKYDIVIVSDDDALNYVMSVKIELFPETPIVFLGINNVEQAAKYGKDPLVTGVVETLSLGDTIEMAYRLNPTAKRVVAITDSTSTGQGDLKSYYKLKNQFKELRFMDLDLSEMSYKELGTELEKVTNEELVLLLSAYMDQEGEIKTFPEYLDFILGHLNQPIYHPYYHGIGDGILGGRVISHYEQGRQAGKLALQILEGDAISEIQTVLESPNPFLVDYQVLKKYGLNEKLLPEDVQLINKEEFPFEKYFWIIIAVLIGFVLQIGLIMFLFWNIEKRKHAEFLIRSKNQELETNNQELINLNQEITHILYNDSLTGLNNRLGILVELDKLLVAFSKTGKEFLILFIDIDNFKNINDTFGHDLGDRVIREAGYRLKELDFHKFRVGRFGGDEFLILCTDISTRFEDTIEKVQECLRNQMVINDNHFYLTTSIGVVRFPKDGETKNELIKKADLALYEAKSNGKNRHALFECSMSTKFEDKVKFQAELKEAFERREFYVKYQPCISPCDDTIVGFEALIRWDSPKFGEVSAYKLITNAEEMGLIVEIGNWVFEEACRFARGINEKQVYQLGVSVNISVAQIMYSNFLKDFEAIIQKVGVSPELLCLEMTETIMIQSIEMGQSLIRELKEFGFKVALDDFGTGYSSLSYLRSLPVDIIKIDKAFIDGIESEKLNQYTLKAIVDLAHQLGFTVIAEGVENQQQVEYLMRHDCDAIQGYFFSRPLLPQDALKYIENYNGGA